MRSHRGGDAARRGGGNARGQGACALGNVPKATKPATPEYLERLQKALASELHARDYYAAAAKSLEGVRRFSNLASAEERHAKAITAVITAFGGKPAAPKQVTVVAPQTLAQADEHCREIEREVIRFYGQLIADCPEEGGGNAWARSACLGPHHSRPRGFWPAQIADLCVARRRRLALESASSSLLELDDLFSARKPFWFT